ncbi:MAG TPA: hypothetical protein VFB22_10705 [Candidatus Baltobacteraceae bacterium]|nr:hypothetical protein [Candidatus Baltobacteraceae bacterium]
MRPLSVAGGALALAASLCVPCLAATVAVPGGTTLTVSVNDPVSSGNVKAGDVVPIHADDDLVVNGWIVVAKGAPGQAEVADAEEAGGNGHAGKLALKFDWIYATDGLKIKLSDQAHRSVGEGSKGASSTATIASYAVLGPLGLFAHNFVKGRNATIDPKTAIPVYVDSTVHVSAKTRSGVVSNDGFAH